MLKKKKIKVETIEEIVASGTKSQRFVLVGTYKKKPDQLAWIRKRHVYNYPLSAEEKGEKTCYIGMTDPSARKVISKEQMSFSIPYSRFLEMEQEADGCFFTTDTWETIKKRI